MYIGSVLRAPRVGTSFRAMEVLVVVDILQLLLKNLNFSYIFHNVLERMGST